MIQYDFIKTENTPMLIDGKAIAADIQKEIKLFVDKQEGIKPCLAVIIVAILLLLKV